MENASDIFIPRVEFNVTASTIYSDGVEPIFCLLYSYFLAKIGCSREDDLNGAFFKFSMTTGISAVLNIFMNLITRMFDVRFQIIKQSDRGIFMNIVSCFSHAFALSMTLGKILTVTTRFTSVYYPFRFKQIWTRRRVLLIIAAQFLLPLAMYSYMPFMVAKFDPTAQNGYGQYLGTDPISFKVAKCIGVAGYLLFFITTIPMCFMTVSKLYKDRMHIASMQQGWTQSGANAARSERILVYASVILTIAHALKATQQIVWVVAIFLPSASLQTSMINLYAVPNALTSFAEPILLLISSKSLRKEIFGGCCPRLCFVAYEARVVQIGSNIIT